MIKVFYSSTSALTHLDYLTLYSALPQWRKELTDKINNADERCRSIVAGALLAHSLTQAGISPHVAVCYNPHGKPYLKDISNVFFSVSHSGEFAVCAISDCDIGCDIQQISAARLSVAKRFFTAHEQDQIHRATLPQFEFARIWTLKESYVKMLGTGISACPLPSFDVSDTQCNIDAVFYEHSCLSGYHLAVCQKQPTNRIIWQQIELI